MIVAGRLNYRTWENQDGDKRSAIEVEADEVAPSLKWATAAVTRQSVGWCVQLGRLGRAGRRARRRGNRTGGVTDRWRVEATQGPRAQAATREGRQGLAEARQAQVLPVLQGQGRPVDYKDVVVLRKFVSERGKIRARRVTGNCVQHQRDVASAVKNAREMALLPYSSR